MSSVHSQSSDGAVQPQMQVVEATAPRFSDKTPAIKEEEETTDSEVVRKKKPSLLRKRSSLHSSPNSTSSSNSNGNSNRSVSTITFEKQKVVPHRARTQSAQSVLSSISLRSLLHQNNMQNQQQQPPQQSGEQETANVNTMNLNQQIQSPALSSIRRRGINSNNANSASNGAATSASTAMIFRRSSSENEIGLQLPFTDDKRRDLESSSGAPQRRLSKSSLSKENTTRTKNNAMPPEKNDDEDYDEDADCQKRLTTQALRKLSNFKATGKSNLRRNTENIVNEQEDAKSDLAQEPPRNDRIEGGARHNDSDTTEDSFINHAGSMTHLKFGNKKVMLDSSSFNPSAYPNKAPSSSVSRPPATIRKHSLDVIRQPNSAANAISTPNSSSKRFVKQICNPKKPLYMPAVLRDVSETNITIDDVVRPASPQHTLTSGIQNNNMRRNQTASSQASINSAHSSILESCKRHISSFFFPGKDHINPDSIGSEAPAPPTREHWLPDSKRSSCHYCHKIFTFLERKHHCRHCGDIFCQQHLAHWLYLNSNAEFMIGCGGMSTLSKICDNCLGDYESMIKNPSGKDKKTNRQMVKGKVPNASLAASQTNQSSGPEAINVEHDSNGDNASTDKGDVIGSVVGSVPADWNWSSF